MSEDTPVRHHFQPRMVQRNFADANSRIYFWRRGMPMGEVRQTKTTNLFVEKNLYTMVNSEGVSHVDLERFYSRLESAAAELLRQIFAVVRAGAIPAPGENAWAAFFHFLYFQMKRGPAFTGAIAQRYGHRGLVEKALVEVLGPQTESDVDRVTKNALLVAQSMAPGDNIERFFAEMGMAIFRVADPSKSFIIGDIASSVARIFEADYFMPVAPDIALGLLAAKRQVRVFDVDRDQVRRMNESIAARCTVIAGTAPALLASLSRVPYRGPQISGPEFTGSVAQPVS